MGSGRRAYDEDELELELLLLDEEWDEELDEDDE